MKTLSLTIILVVVACANQQVTITSDTPLLKAIMPKGIPSKVLMWGKLDTMEDLKVKVKLAQPNDGCEPYTNSDKKDEFAFYIKRGGACSLGTKIHNA